MGSDRYRFKPAHLSVRLAYEDRVNIARYLVESYGHLSIMVTQAKNHEISATELSEKTMWVMTDSVLKTLLFSVQELVC